MQQKKFILGILGIFCTHTYLYGYDYLPDDIPLNQVLLISAHNLGQSKAYGWRYYQQLGTIEQQWNAGARGGKLNLHWRRPISPAAQIKETLERTKVGKAVKKAGNFISTFFGPIQ